MQTKSSLSNEDKKSQYNVGPDRGRGRNENRGRGRGRNENSGRGRNENSGRGRNENNGEGRNEHSGRGRNEHSGRGRNEHSGRGRNEHNGRGRSEHSGRGRSEHSSRGRSEHSGRHENIDKDEPNESEVIEYGNGIPNIAVYKKCDRNYLAIIPTINTDEKPVSNNVAKTYSCPTRKICKLYRNQVRNQTPKCKETNFHTWEHFYFKHLLDLKHIFVKGMKQIESDQKKNFNIDYTSEGFFETFNKFIFECSSGELGLYVDSLDDELDEIYFEYAIKRDNFI